MAIGKKKRKDTKPGPRPFFERNTYRFQSKSAETKGKEKITKGLERRKKMTLAGSRRKKGENDKFKGAPARAGKKKNCTASRWRNRSRDRFQYKKRTKKSRSRSRALEKERDYGRRATPTVESTVSNNGLSKTSTLDSYGARPPTIIPNSKLKSTQTNAIATNSKRKKSARKKASYI